MGTSEAWEAWSRRSRGSTLGRVTKMLGAGEACRCVGEWGRGDGKDDRGHKDTTEFNEGMITIL